MVTVKNFHVRQGKDEKFISLELLGDIELIQSSTTGRHYATARHCFISSTFDEATAQMMVGKQISGNIVRVTCDEYDYTVPETGEVIKLGYSWDYRPEEPAPNPKMLTTATA